MLKQYSALLSSKRYFVLTHPLYGTNASWLFTVLGPVREDGAILEIFLAENQNNNIVISGEELCRLKPQYFRIFTDRLISMGYNVKLFCTIRNPHDYLGSSIPQYIVDKRLVFDDILNIEDYLPNYENVIELKDQYGEYIRIIPYSGRAASELFRRLFEVQIDNNTLLNSAISRNAAKFLIVVGNLLSDHERHAWVSLFRKIPFGEERFLVPQELLDRHLPRLNDAYRRLLPESEELKIDAPPPTISLSYYNTLDIAFMTQFSTYVFSAFGAQSRGSARLFARALQESLDMKSAELNFIGYIGSNPDLSFDEIFPIAHYKEFGAAEGRQISAIGENVIAMLDEALKTYSSMRGCAESSPPRPLQ